MYQDALFREYLDPVKLKEGKTKCPCCGKLMRAYAKTLDKRLIKQAWDILVWVSKNRRKRFTLEEVFEGNHKNICDSNKLHYWGIIERAKNKKTEPQNSGWYLKEKGYRFLMGEIQLPKRVWVFNNRVLEVEDTAMVNVSNADERWQACRADYTQDYVPYKYETQPKI